MQRSIELLELESGIIAKNTAAIATVSFFEGDLTQAYAFIKERFASIVQANPWLGGRLRKGFMAKRVNLDYDEIDIETLIFLNPEGLSIHSELTYADITTSVEPYIVKSPQHMLNTEAKVCSLVLTQSSKDHFAMIFSVSHSVVDGHAYYQLLNMFSKENEVYALSAIRKDETNAQIKNGVGRNTYDYFVGAAHVINALFGMATAKRAKVFAYYVDQEKIEEIKKAHTRSESCEYISSNDILSSSFAVFTKVRLLLMAINFRGKLKALTQNDAGNYEAVVLYDEEYYQSPCGIRKAISHNEPYRGLGKPLPSFFEGVRCKMALITNWATFSQELNLEGCKETLHLPLNHASGKMPYEFAIIFRAKGNEHAVAYYTNRFSEEDFTLSDLPIGNCVSSAIFSDHSA